MVLNLIIQGMWGCGQVGELKFVFEGKTIQRMELLVLSTLKWKMQACTPFSFIDYFLGNINEDHQPPSGSLVSRSIQLILSTIRGLSLHSICVIFVVMFCNA